MIAKTASYNSLLALLVGPGIVSASVLETLIPNPEFGEQSKALGASLSLDGDTFVAGAPESPWRSLPEAGSVRVYREAGTNDWQLEREIVSDSPAQNGRFGRAVAVSGDTLAIGAPGEDPPGETTGAVWIQRRTGSVWENEAMLTSPPGLALSAVGEALVLEGNTLVHSGYLSTGIGFFVYTRTGSTWTFAQQLVLPTPAPLDSAPKLALSGDTLLISGDDAAGLGSVQVYQREGGVWSHHENLSLIDLASGDHFGRGIAVEGDLAVFGAPGVSDSLERQGAAWIYRRSAGSWAPEQRIVSPDPATNAGFGTSVAISGDAVIIGSPASDAFQNAAPVSVFRKSGGVWSESERLANSPGRSLTDKFGASIAADADTLVVGASGDVVSGHVGGGAVSLYQFAAGGSTFLGKRYEDQTASSDYFGSRVLFDGDRLLISSLRDTVGGRAAGSVYSYVRVGREWTPIQKLNSPAGSWDDFFGASLSVSGDDLVVGATFAETASRVTAGKVYLYSRSGSQWLTAGQLEPPSPSTNGNFGAAASILGDLMAVGAPGDDGAGENSGAVHFYSRTAGVWSLEATHRSSTTNAEDEFGSSVRVGGSYCFIAAPWADLAGNERAGAVYVLHRDLGAWTPLQKLTAPIPTASGGFGASLDVYGEMLVVGEAGADGSENTHLFRNTGSTYEFLVSLPDPSGAAGQDYGAAVSYDRGLLAVGIPHASDFAPHAGRAQLFRFDGGFAPADGVVASDRAANDVFAGALDLDRGRLVVGASNKSAPESWSGAVYYYDLAPEAAPSGLRAESITATALQLVWVDQSRNEDGFVLRRDMGPGPATSVVQTLPADSTTASVDGLGPNQQHSFALVGYTAYGESSSIALTIRTAAATPSAPVALALGESSIQLSLGADDNPADVLFAIREGTSGKWLQDDGTLENTEVWRSRTDWTNFTLAGLAAYQKHYLGAKARNSEGLETPLGPEVQVQTADLTPPDSKVLSPFGDWLLVGSRTTVPIEWTSADFGSGVTEVELFYSRNGGAHESYGKFSTSPILFDTALTGGTGKYEVFTIAHDLANNIESPPAIPDTTINVVVRDIWIAE